MADYNINANITANTKGYETNIKKAQASTKNFSTSLSKVIQGLGKNGLVGALGAVGLASAGMVATLGAVVKIAKKVSETINECTEAYKKQIIAERQLSTAVNNNPLVTGEGERKLKAFASAMQKVTNYGDEELLPMLSNLIALGRTEDEAMQIMTVALDMSASGAMSLDTAITQLNATLNGNVGRLGLQNAELKGLTEEELKNGKAVEILGEKYKGLASATVDTSKQLKNAMGDFKEVAGEFITPTSDSWNKFWTGFFERGVEVIKQFDDYLDKTIIGKGIAEELLKGMKSIKDTREQTLYLEDNIHALTESQLNALAGHLENTKKRTKEQERLLEKVNMEKEARIYLAKVYDEMDKAQADEQERIEKQKETENEIAILKGKYLEKIAEQERKWKNIKAVTGEEVETEEKIAFYQNSLVDLMTQAGGQITTNNQLYKDQIKIIEQLQSTLAEPVEAEEEKKTSDSWYKKIRDQAIARLETEKEVEIKSEEFAEKTAWEKYQIERNYNERLKGLAIQRLEEEKAEALKSVEDYANADEEKTRIEEYYQNEIADTVEKYATKYKSAGEIASDSFADGFKTVTKKLTPIVNEIGKVLGRVANVAKSMFQGGVSIFKKVFEIDVDTVLDAILKIEDKVLSFFVETLPKLPQFVASVMQSISVLLESVLQVVTPERISEIIISIMQTIQQYAPTIIGAIADILSNMLDGIINSLPQILDTLNVVVEKLAEVLPQLIQKLIDLFIGILKEPQKIAQLVVTIIKGFVEIFNVLLRNIGPLLEALLPAIGTMILEIIKAIPDILATMAEAIGEALKGIGKFIVNALVDILNLMFDGISKAWTWIPGAEGIPHIPHLATGTDNAKKGLTLVGEAGPELVRFNGGEQVLNNRNTQKALAGIGGNSNDFTVNFYNTKDTTAYAMMSQLKQYNRQMAINGVI
jgi:hypothetical protein